MRRLTTAALLIGGAAVLVSVGPTAYAGTKAARAETRCKIVVKLVKGHHKRVRICKPNPKPKADLVIAMTSSLRNVTSGNQVVYTLTVRNLGPENARHAELSVDFPAAFEYAYPVASPFRSLPRCEGKGGGETTNWTCKLGKLRPPNEDPLKDAPYVPPIRILFVAESEEVGNFAVAARVTTTSRDRHKANNAATTTTSVLPGPASADLSVNLSLEPNPVGVADDLTETVAVTNRGPTEATFVTVPILLPLGTEIVDFQGVPFSEACPFLLTGPSSLTLCWVALAAGETAQVTLTLTPTRRAPPNLTSTAIVSSYTPDPALTNNRAEATTTLAPFDPAPGVDLVASFGIPSPAVVGEEFETSFRIVNRGAETARNVHFVLTPSRDLTVIGVGLNHGFECEWSGSQGVDCTVSALESGSRLSGEFYGETDSPGPLTVTLTTSSSVPDTHPGDNTAMVTFQVAASSASFTSWSASSLCSRRTAVYVTRPSFSAASWASSTSWRSAAFLTLYSPRICLTRSSESETTSSSSTPSSTAFARPATRPRYSATLLVATPIVSPWAARTWPSSASST